MANEPHTFEADHFSGLPLPALLNELANNTYRSDEEEFSAPNTADLGRWMQSDIKDRLSQGGYEHDPAFDQDIPAILNARTKLHFDCEARLGDNSTTMSWRSGRLPLDLDATRTAEDYELWIQYCQTVYQHVDPSSVTRSYGFSISSKVREDSSVPGVDHPDVTAADIKLGPLLGSGSQGAVYAARVLSTGLVVAVKVIRDKKSFGLHMVELEARVAAKLKHPNILRVFGYYRAGDFWVVVMELLCGFDLKDAKLGPQEVALVAARMADAVLTMATAGVVHRDIKPANIVWRFADRSPVLIDFGLAVDLNTVEDYPRFGGTPLFMPPEAFNSTPAEPSWDAYSLGVTLASLLSYVPHWNELRVLRQKKLTGEFDRELLCALRQLPRDDLRTACEGLLGPAAERMSAVAQARKLAPASRWRTVWERIVRTCRRSARCL